MSFRKRLSAGEFVVLAEMHTPKGVNISKMVMDSRRIKGRVDAIASKREIAAHFIEAEKYTLS